MSIAGIPISSPAGPRILVVRLGAMGDILHALPAASTLKHSFPGSRLTWAVEARWAPLLEANPFIDRLVLVRRDSASGLLKSLQDLRQEEYDFAVDFQGLLKSAFTACAARPERIFGFAYPQIRERAAALFYSHRVLSAEVHVVRRNLDLAAAAGATNIVRVFPLPPGKDEGPLPTEDFVLASPLAGWRAKQWPLEHYRELASLLHREMAMTLVLDVPSGTQFEALDCAVTRSSSLAGLIYATRRATAVVGVDSGPLHLAAALGKPGVAIFGPTDPARNGPYGDSLRILRDPHVITTYKRGNAIDDSMRNITPDQVFESLRTALRQRCLIR